jgi:hypothetical protein
VVANPVFYPDVKPEVRRQIFAFVKNILSAERFDFNAANEYIILPKDSGS